MTKKLKTLKRHYGILGGAFDPAHVGHYLIASYYLALHPTHQLLIIPSYQHPFLKKMLDFEIRFKHCQMMAQQLGPRAHALAIEKEIPHTSYTYHVIKKLRQIYPQSIFELIVGADAYEHKESWYLIEKLEKMASFFVVGRAHKKSPQGYLSFPSISSTQIRKKIKQQKNCGALLLKDIYTDILKNKYYYIDERLLKRPHKD